MKAEIFMCKRLHSEMRRVWRIKLDGQRMPVFDINDIKRLLWLHMAGQAKVVLIHELCPECRK